MFDDKELSKGDRVSFLVSGTNQEFAKARLISVKDTKLGKLKDEDWEGHEKFESEKEMYATYCRYYRQKVDEDTSVKIIRFELL